MADFEKELKALYDETQALEQKATALKQKWGACEVQDYTLQGPEGPVKLSQSFGDFELMVLVHNMGHQ